MRVRVAWAAGAKAVLARQRDLGRVMYVAFTKSRGLRAGPAPAADMHHLAVKCWDFSAKRVKESAA